MHGILRQKFWAIALILLLPFNCKKESVSPNQQPTQPVVVPQAGPLWNWGQVATIDITSALQVGSDQWKSISSGNFFSIALRSDGTLWGWGKNDYGQLGIGTYSSLESTPVQIGSDNDWALISAGVFHALAVKTNGTLWTWGHFFSQTNKPTQVGSGTDWKRISAGEFGDLAIKTDGTLWGWGVNGILGDASSNEVKAWTQIGNSSWAEISVSKYYALGIKSDGTLWSWGGNEFGQLGNGAMDGIFNVIPATINQVGSDNTWTKVSAGFNHALGLKKNGTLWSWGRSLLGSLGTGATSNVLIPAQVGASSDWSIISSGYLFSLALKADGSLYGWGYNNHGQLGDGTIINREVPTLIKANQKWIVVSAGTFSGTGISK